MTYKEWVIDLDIRDDIDEVHNLYNTVKECSSQWGYDITPRKNGFKVSKSSIVPHVFTQGSKTKLCDYLDGWYDLGVEGEYARAKGMKRI